MACLCGCGKKTADKVDDDKSKAPPPVAVEDPKRLYTGPGTATEREKEGARRLLYEISWKSSSLDYTQTGGAKSGRLDGVAGKLYQEGNLASTFTAKNGYAERELRVLKLEGEVTVVGLQPAGTLKCNRLEWHTDEKLLKAFGKVTIVGKEGRIGPLDELWCLPNLKRAGTPGYFR